MVSEHQWHWPYCLWLKTKAEHLAKLDPEGGIIELDALKECYDRRERAAEEADLDVGRSEMQSEWLLKKAAVPGTESIKHRALATKS